ncbi:MAG: glycosyltransferase family 4 protein [Marinobacter sp.]|nr:glycosyltransferase family 4 protein [Marinobacter sp.]
MSLNAKTRPSPRVLCLTDACDRPETELFIGLKRAGFDVAVMCNPKGPNYERLEQAGLVAGPIALTGRFDKTGTRAIKRQLDEQPCDIIHAYNPRALACALRASKGTNIRIVAYRGVIGNISFLNPESWLTFLHPRVSRIVCVADAIRNYLASLRFLWFRLPPSRLQRIYKGHDLSWYQAEPNDLSEFGVTEGAFVVCCTGRDVPRKGFDVLVSAVAALPPDVNVHLVLVGDLGNNETLRAQVASTAHPERIHFTGFRRDAPTIAAASDVFVLPSTEREGLPRAVIEAMAYGVPAIVTDVGGMPELVENNVSGFVVPPKDVRALSEAIEKLYRNGDIRERMGHAARRRIDQDFNTAQTVRETGDLYRTLVAD